MRIRGSFLPGVAASLAALALTAAPAAAAEAVPDPPAPPPQPAKGPGGAAHRWGAMRAVFHDAADDSFDYWTYEPRQWTGKPARKPARVPVVFFLHGYNATSPSSYEAWISHLVLRGSILVYPRYQAGPFVPTSTYTPNAIAALQSAVPWLRQNARPKPRFADGVNVIGHSYGGAVATNVSARAGATGLPKPASIMLANPFVENATFKPQADAIDPDLSAIPRGTELDCVVADVDSFAGRLGCDEVFARTGHLKPGNRSYAWMYGDAHGLPPLSISHFSASNASPVDALDYYGYWELADAIGSCALADHSCAYALGGGSRERYMGTWSDGVPVRALDVSSAPPPCPPGTLAYGC
jgi:acetyl esterase/lipase